MAIENRLDLKPVSLKADEDLMVLNPIGEEIITDFQTIKFYETLNNKLVLTLDTFIQFIEGEDSDTYHDMLTKPAIERNPKAKDVLILGGGDGLVAKNIYEYIEDSNVTLVELDPKMIDIFSTDLRLRQMNNDSLLKCKVFTEDAMQWIPNCKDKFDIIINDFPDPNGEVLKQLYSKDFLKQIIDLLNKDGVIVIQCHEDIALEVLDIVKDLLGNAEELKYDMPMLSGGSVILGICR